MSGLTLTEAPAVEPPSGLEAGELAASSLQKAALAANQAREKRNAEASGAGATAAGIQSQIEKLDLELADKPSSTEVDTALAAINAADAQLKSTASAASDVETAADSAKSELAAATAAGVAAWTAFDTARDPVAAMGAPGRVADDLSATWTGLVAWASKTAIGADAASATARIAAAASRSDIETTTNDQIAACAEIGIIVGPGSPRDAVLQRAATLAADIKLITAQIAERRALEVQTAATREYTAVAHALENHLRSNHFERWYLEEALRRLAHGASQRLAELSDGQYAPGLEGAEFTGIDHVNADETRPVKTLSGGETFLASLALALALADEVQSMAAAGSPKLEALFLDEGFGTLDSDTLDVVRVAVSELATQGRMVGIVTHVRELADSVPTQFRVTKDGHGSHVERVEA